MKRKLEDTHLMCSRHYTRHSVHGNQMRANPRETRACTGKVADTQHRLSCSVPSWCLAALWLKETVAKHRHLRSWPRLFLGLFLWSILYLQASALSFSEQRLVPSEARDKKLGEDTGTDCSQGTSTAVMCPTNKKQKTLLRFYNSLPQSRECSCLATVNVKSKIFSCKNVTNLISSPFTVQIR